MIFVDDDDDKDDEHIDGGFRDEAGGDGDRRLKLDLSWLQLEVVANFDAGHCGSSYACWGDDDEEGEDVDDVDDDDDDIDEEVDNFDDIDDDELLAWSTSCLDTGDHWGRGRWWKMIIDDGQIKGKRERGGCWMWSPGLPISNIAWQRGWT